MFFQNLSAQSDSIAIGFLGTDLVAESNDNQLTFYTIAYFTFGFNLGCPDSESIITNGGDNIIIENYYDATGLWVQAGCFNPDTFFFDILDYECINFVVNSNVIQHGYYYADIDTVFEADSDIFLAILNNDLYQESLTNIDYQTNVINDSIEIQISLSSNFSNSQTNCLEVDTFLINYSAGQILIDYDIDFSDGVFKQNCSKDTIIVIPSDSTFSELVITSNISYHDLYTSSTITEDNITIDTININWLNNNEFYSPLMVEVFPNPFKHTLFINGLNEIQFERIELYDLSGKRILIKKIDTNEINLKNLESGIYFLSIYYENESITKTIIKH